MTIQTSAKSAQAVGKKRSWATVIVGSSALWAWGFLAYLSPIFITDALTSQLKLETAFFTSQATVVVLAGCLLFVGRKHALSVGRLTLLACAVGLFAASLLLPQALITNNLILLLACGITSGIAATFLGAAWGTRYSLEPRDVSSIVLLSFLVAYALYLGITHLPNQHLAGFIVAALPIISWLLWLKDASARHGLSTEVFPQPRLRGKVLMPGEVTAGIWESRILPWRRIGIIIVAAFTGSSVASLIMGTSYNGAETLFMAGVVVCSFITIMAFVPFTASRETFTVSQLYRITISFTVVGLVLITIIGEDGVAVGGALIQGCAIFLQALIYVIVTRTTRSEGLSPLLSFSVGQAVIAGVLLAGNLLGKLLFVLFGSSTLLLSATCGAGVLGLFFMLLALVPKQAATSAKQSASASSTSTAPVQDTTPSLHEAPQATNCLDAFVKTYGLTSREAEILEYLVRGRSLPYVANELFVTTGTIKTHVRHIYAKTNVNSRQELLDAVEHFITPMQPFEEPLHIQSDSE